MGTGSKPEAGSPFFPLHSSSLWAESSPSTLAAYGQNLGKADSWFAESQPQHHEAKVRGLSLELGGSSFITGTPI